MVVSCLAINIGCEWKMMILHVPRVSIWDGRESDMVRNQDKITMFKNESMYLQKRVYTEEKTLPNLCQKHITFPNAPPLRNAPCMPMLAETLQIKFFTRM
jgi:hypothetical protein